jgi:hypothetical protein
MADLKISALTSATTPLAGTEVLPIVQSGATKQVSVANLTDGRALSMSGLTVTPAADASAVATIAAASRSTAGQSEASLILTAVSRETTNNRQATYVLRVNPDSDFGAAGLGFEYTYDGTPYGARMTLTSGGNLAFPSGAGIDFSATPGTGTSELLADYEEGTYTAVLTPQTSGTIPLNSSFDELAYTKVGRLVTVTGQIQTFNPSLPVGAFFTLNLPFTPADLTELAGRGGFMLNYQNTAVSANWEEGVASIYVNKNASTVLTGENLFLSFSYFAA